MIRLFLSFYFIFCTLFIFANGLLEANDLMKSKKVKEAILKYESYIRNHNDVSAYYNLGIAYHQNNEHGKAIWAFEKVLKLDPKDEEAYQQIMACQKDIEPTNDWSPILNTFESNLYSYSSDFWAYFAIGFGMLTSFLIVLYAKKKDSKYILFFILASLGMTFFTIYAASGAQSFQNDQYGIAVVETTILENMNGQMIPSQKLMLEGTRVIILEDVDGEYLTIIDESGDNQFIHKSAVRSF